MTLVSQLSAIVLGLFSFAGDALSAELVMFRREGCPYCHAFDRAIGTNYGKSDIARRAPMRMVDLDRDKQPKIALSAPIRFTPTFVLVDNGREIGRIEGYAGEDFFWGRLEVLMQRAPKSSTGEHETIPSGATT